MFVVGVFELRRVHCLVVRAEEGKTDGDKDCEADRGAQGGVYRGSLQLLGTVSDARSQNMSPATNLTNKGVFEQQKQLLGSGKPLFVA